MASKVSITIQNCNNSLLPPLLLPALHVEDKQPDKATKANVDRLRIGRLKMEDYTRSSTPRTDLKNYDYGSFSRVDVRETFLTPPSSNTQSSAITACSSLDNLASLASVAVASAQSYGSSCQNSGSATYKGFESVISKKSLKRSYSLDGSEEEEHLVLKEPATRNSETKASRKNSSSPLSPRTPSTERSSTFECNVEAPNNEGNASKLSALELNGAKIISSSMCKRQRTGPSCDVCRSKKIKCDATVIVIWQHCSLFSMDQQFSESISLHSPLSIETCSAEILERIPDEIKQQLVDRKDMSLVRHVDKLIAFTPCSSCSKKKNCECSFSKGFTRNDIAVFSSLNKKFGKRSSLGDFTVEDYLSVGYTFD